jgi:hypothetical protein
MKPSSRHDLISLRIVFRKLFVNRSVHLDYDPRGMAIEVNNKSCDDLLPSEVQAVEAVGAEMSPQVSLRFGHLAAQLLCALYLYGIGTIFGDSTYSKHENPSLIPSPRLVWGA